MSEVGTALARPEPRPGLVVSNPSVQIISARLGWRPETLVRRVAAALPALLEQELYLRVADSVQVRPESVAKILRLFLGARTLQAHDMFDVIVGKNLSVNPFVDTLALVLETLAVTNVMRDDYGTQLGAESAARLVQAYGPDNVEHVVDSLFAFVSATYGEESPRRLRTALHWLANEGLDWCASEGVPYPNDVADWLAENREARRRLLRYVGFPKEPK